MMVIDDLVFIQRTEISEFQISAGVEWKEGELAFLVVGFAATSDEHVDILANSVEVIEDETAEQIQKRMTRT